MGIDDLHELGSADTLVLLGVLPERARSPGLRCGAGRHATIRSSVCIAPPPPTGRPRSARATCASRSTSRAGCWRRTASRSQTRPWRCCTTGHCRRAGRAIERRERSFKADRAAIDPSLLDALAPEQLGDPRAAGASSERAPDLAEPEGVVLPLVGRGPAAQPVRGSQTRTAHATCSRDPGRARGIAGAGPRRSSAAARGAERGRAARGTVPPEQPPAHRDRGGAVRLLEHGADAPAPHLRQARRAHSRSEAVARARELGLSAPASRVR